MFEYSWKKRDVPCMDCDNRFPPYCMDFDHRDGETKEFNVSQMLRAQSWSKFIAEIEKCDVVCSNCHRKRTAKRSNYYGQYDTSVVQNGLDPGSVWSPKLDEFGLTPNGPA